MRDSQKTGSLKVIQMGFPFEWTITLLRKFTQMWIFLSCCVPNLLARGHRSIIISSVSFIWKMTPLGVCMWNTIWKTCDNVLFSHSFHTFFTHFSHAFLTHIPHACEILHSEIYVKRVSSDVIPFTDIFTYTSHGVSHRLSHVNPHLNSRIFSYTSHRVSHRLSHVLNPQSLNGKTSRISHDTNSHIIFTYASHGVSHELSHVNPQRSEIMNGNRISLPCEQRFIRKQTNYPTEKPPKRLCKR